MSAKVAVSCNHCGHMYALPREFLGKKATCKSCGQKFVAVEKQIGPAMPTTAPVAAKPAASSTAAPAAAQPSKPSPSVVLPSKREVPITPAPRVTAPAASANRMPPRSMPAGDSLDDSVLAWLDEADSDDAPPPPRVVTTADICDPSQRQQLRGPSAAAVAEKTPAAPPAKSGPAKS